jgi:predicted DsbA family dithiol-disulfide isomerase
MKVEIWSDIPCPWCYIGRRRYEKALAAFEHAEEVETIWRSYQLDPSTPRVYEGTADELLIEKFGMNPSEAKAAHAKLVALAAQDGLDYRFDRARPGNSFDAHRLIHYAVQFGLQSEMKERIQRAYFTEGMAFGDPDILILLGTEVGLDADATRRVLESDAYADDVRSDIHRAKMIGCSGVPFFVFDEKSAVSGAQPAEIFLQALEQARAESTGD